MSIRVEWFVVRTKPRQEERARDNLLRQGFDAFSPQFYDPTIRRRRSRADCSLVPLFPGYAFCGLDLDRQGCGAIRSTIGVIDLVRFGDYIPALSGQVIDALRDREAAMLAQGESSFAAGDSVVVISGPLAGLAGAFQCQSGPQRVQVLLDILGRPTSARVPSKCIAASL